MKSVDRMSDCKALCGRMVINPLNAGLNPICHLLALLGAHPILHVSRLRVNEMELKGSRCITIIHVLLFFAYDQDWRTGLVTFCVETAFYNGLLKERYKEG